MLGMQMKVFLAVLVFYIALFGYWFREGYNDAKRDAEEKHFTSINCCLRHK
jgi:hypothetical protein